MTNQQGAPEALRLADALQAVEEGWSVADKCCAELRRLHAENERLAALVEAQQPAAYVQNPAEIEHVAGDVSKNGPESNMAQQPAPSAAAMGDVDLPDAEDMAHSAVQEALSFGLSHDVIYHWMRHIQDQTVKAMLAAPQPSPTPQADESPIPADYGDEPRLGCGLEGARPKIEWIVNTAYAMRNMHTLDSTWRGQLITMAAAADFVAKQIAALEPTPQADSAPTSGNWVSADDVNRLVRELDVALNGEAGAAVQASLCDVVAQVRLESSKRGQPLLAPQADSQPAPQGETNAQLDTDSNSPTPGQQRDVAGPVAVGQPVGNRTDQAASHLGTQGNKLLTVAERNIRSFLRSASFKSESDREAALNCVDVLWAAARAPADSVTAPAGGAVAGWSVKVGPAGLEWLIAEINKLPTVSASEIDGEESDGTPRHWRNRPHVSLRKLERLLREFFTPPPADAAPTPPAQAADSVLEDAADPLQGAANWLAEAHGQFCVAVLQGCLMIGYNRAKRLHDVAIAARKQGGA